MTTHESKVLFYKSLPDVDAGAESALHSEHPLLPDAGNEASTIGISDIGGTCTDAETFALRVLDDSMEPEFRRGCIIIIDPTGRATHGSFVLAQLPVDRDTLPGPANPTPESEGFVFRQLKRGPQPEGVQSTWHLAPLNQAYQAETTPIEIDAVVGVIVQRAGTRRRYHKRYD